MPGVIIEDGVEEHGGLAFDLSEVLAALGRSPAHSAWTGRGLSYVSDDDVPIPVLDQIGAGGTVSGADLLAALPQLHQVIDGEFDGVGADGRVWVRIRAVDSTWWEVHSEDPEVIDAVRTSFRTVRDAPVA